MSGPFCHSDRGVLGSQAVMDEGARMGTRFVVGVWLVLLVACGGGVTPPGRPMDEGPWLRLTVDREQVPPGEGVNLRWESWGLRDCRAEGAWTGARAPAGGEFFGPLAQDARFTLFCRDGEGNALRAEVRVEVFPPAPLEAGVIVGEVDGYWITGSQPSWLRLFPAEGAVTSPLAEVAVTRRGACRYGYRFEGVPPGRYRLELWRGDERRWQGEVTLDGGVVDFPVPPPRVVRVGPGGDFATPAEAARGVEGGTVVEIAEGRYVDDVAVWRQSGLVLRGVGGWVELESVSPIEYRPGDDSANGKAIWVIRGEDVRVEGIRFRGAHLPGGGNAAGIRLEPSARRVSLCRTEFVDNENGLMGSANDLRIEFSRFVGNGAGDGRTHNLYLVEGSESVVFYASASVGARIGHQFKSRARRTELWYSILADGNDGTSSYALDVPDGGEVLVVGSLLQKGPRADNPVLLAFGAEGLVDDGRRHRLILVHNTLVNRNGFGGEAFFGVDGGIEAMRLFNNLFVGSAQRFFGEAVAVEEGGNLTVSDREVRDAAAGDYRPVAGGRAVDAAFPLPEDLPMPSWQPAGEAVIIPRERLGAGWDVGAYEVP